MVESLPAISLRPWTTDDEARLAAWFAHAEVPRYLVPRKSGINLSRHGDHGWVFLESATQTFAILDRVTHADSPIGLGALHSPTKGAVELGLVIGEPSVWGRGYGRAATLALVDEAFKDRDCGRVVARIQPDNARALACYRAVGFESRKGHAREPVWLYLTRTAWVVQRARRRGISAEA